MSGLASKGKLRVGVASAPSASPLFIVKDADGAPRGVTVDLGHALAKELGVAVEFMVAPALLSAAAISRSASNVR